MLSVYSVVNYSEPPIYHLQQQMQHLYFRGPKNQKPVWQKMYSFSVHVVTFRKYRHYQHLNNVKEGPRNRKMVPLFKQRLNTQWRVSQHGCSTVLEKSF